MVSCLAAGKQKALEAVCDPCGEIAAVEFGSPVFVDTSGEPWRQALKAQPDFVNPNQEEAEWLSGHVIDGLRSAGNVLKAIIGEGAGAGVISLGSRGLLWQRAKDVEVLFARAPEMIVRSTVGQRGLKAGGFCFCWSPRTRAG
jgi:1-phosphofructokinase